MTLPRVTVTVTIEGLPDENDRADIAHSQIIHADSYYIVNFNAKTLRTPQIIEKAAEDSLSRVMSYIFESYVETGRVSDQMLSRHSAIKKQFILDDSEDTVSEDRGSGKWQLSLTGDAPTPTHFDQVTRREYNND